MLKVNDFFCGAGGFGLAFKQAGFEIAGAWDFDKFAVQTYAHNIGDHVKQADIREMTAKDVPTADVWTFGFPCQDLSVAGKQKGMIKGKTRSGLFYEVMRLLEEIEPERKPRIILAENVKGLKKYLPVLQEEYKKVGYTMYYELYNSKFWGVPQNRERYYVVGVREDINEIFSMPQQDETFVPKLSSILENHVEEKYYIADEKAKNVIEQAKKRVELKGIHATITPDRLKKRQKGRRSKEEEEEMFTLTAQDLHGVIEPDTKKIDKIGGIWGKRQAGSAFNKNGIPQIDVVGKLDIKGQDNVKRVYNPEGLAPTLTTSEGGNRQPKVVEGCIDDRGFKNKNIKIHEISPTIRAEEHGNQKKVIEVYPRFRVRKLTPREYARLQGFPDTFEQIVSNTQFYKQMGNAVTVPLAQAVAESIKEFLLGLENDKKSDCLERRCLFSYETITNNSNNFDSKRNNARSTRSETAQKDKNPSGKANPIGEKRSTRNKTTGMG